MGKKKPSKRASQDSSVVFVDQTANVISDDEPSDTETSGPLERHPEFCFDNTLIAIQIGKTLFNVHKYQLAKSEVFADRFKKPKAEGDEPEEGSSLDHPIKLKGVAASDFAALLRVLYASQFSSNQPAPEPSLIIPAFRLANVLKFAELRALLLPLAETKLDDVDRIVFAKEFGIKEWLAPAHIRLCRREEPLSGEEARKLGVESVLIVSHMREKHPVRPSASTLTTNQNYCYNCLGVDSTSGTTTCTGCNNRYSGNLRYTGAGKLGGASGASTTDNTAVEEGVKKWVEDGCTMKD